MNLWLKFKSWPGCSWQDRGGWYKGQGNQQDKSQGCHWYEQKLGWCRFQARNRKTVSGVILRQCEQILTGWDSAGVGDGLCTRPFPAVPLPYPPQYGGVNIGLGGRVDHLIVNVPLGKGKIDGSLGSTSISTVFILSTSLGFALRAEIIR